MDKATQVKWEKTDGLKIFQNELICVLKGSAKSILAAERVSLNFLQTLSATATETHNYMERIKEVKEKKCLILDTRKTLPGLRLAQKYAVRVGGGSNQRFGLWDSVLLKENHLISLGGFTSLIRRYGNAASAAEVEKINLDHFQIEVENMHEYSLATAFGAKQILLDNFSITDLKKAVSLNMNEAILEASGNISLLNIRDIVMTGVDRVSIGGLTKNLNAIDFTLRFKSASSRLR